ncbi:MAG: hypothetical protein GOVbin703_160 [Prokaryotic dsDNA virus sp.]|nr:MAG: hypothetical protein GOVbin703_160 [Prokaryotic dsDNA virus sp.]|tara:strand:+ start:81 stop:296 length:216 start_codon:yes stop_codon:yes gene_type:complete
MWKVYKYNGTYIQGDLISQHKTESAALKKAKKEINFTHAVKDSRKDEKLIWLDAEDHTPVGIIVKKTKGGT